MENDVLVNGDEFQSREIFLTCCLWIGECLPLDLDGHNVTKRVDMYASRVHIIGWCYYDA